MISEIFEYKANRVANFLWVNFLKSRFCLFFTFLVHKVIQWRSDGSVDFYRNWAEYENGFGSPQPEKWLGEKEQNENCVGLEFKPHYKM